VIRRGAATVLFRSDDGQVLLVLEDYGARRWSLPGGLIENGETPQEAAIREVREETGLQAELGEHIGTYRIRHPDGDGIDVDVFLAASWTGTPQENPGEIAELRWFDPRSMPTRTSNVLPWAVTDAAAGRRGVIRDIPTNT
jgi:8-oxo-dGTP pyrophosphatase MutT (NUDIX family)